MKKIYTFFKRQSLALLLLGALSSTTTFAQPICGPIVEDFENNMGSTRGFTGDFSAGTVGTDGVLIRQNVVTSAIYTITTPTYRLPASASFIGFGFELDGSERVARAEAAIIYVSTFTNQLTTVFLAQFVPAYNPNSTTADVCRAVALSDLPGFPTGGQYRFRFELTTNTGSGQMAQFITFDDFRTNGVFSPQPLPVNFIGFEARKASTGVQLTWKVAGEERIARYEVERSLDGRNFSSIASVNRGGKDTYNYVDAANTGTVYYRIKNVDEDGKFKYSSIARFANGKSDILIKAFPQPVQNLLTLQHPSIRAKALITVSTADGRSVRTVVPANGSMQTPVDMSSLQKGMYMIRFDDGEGSSETLKVIKQ